MTDSFMYDWSTATARTTQWLETRQILLEIHNQIIRDDRKYIYQHKVG